MTHYTNETLDGTVLAEYPDIQTAITDAKTRLEDDPELREVYVWAHGSPQGPLEIGRATHVPDADWQSVVGWLYAGEPIEPPDGAFRCDPDESAGMAEAYELSDPKHPDFHSVHADIWDARAGK